MKQILEMFPVHGEMFMIDGMEPAYMRLSRRAFVSQAAVLSCASGLLARGRATGDPKLTFPKKAQDRISITSYPFRTFIDSPTNSARKKDLPGFDMQQFPALMVEKFNVHHINPLADHFRSKDSAYLDGFVRALEKAHSHIVDLGLGGKAFYSEDSQERDEAVQYGQRGIDMAKAVGSPSVRQHLHGKGKQKPSVELAAQSLGRLAEYGAKQKIVVNLENDSPVSEDPFFLANVLEKVGNPYLRGLPDFGNSLINHDAEFNERAVAGMLKHAFNLCHVKDEVENESGATQKVDLKKMFALAREHHFQGYFSMEFETRLGDPYTGTKKLMEETLQYLS